jgi:hypothetical protein
MRATQIMLKYVFQHEEWTLTSILVKVHVLAHQQLSRSSGTSKQQQQQQHNHQQQQQQQQQLLSSSSSNQISGAALCWDRAVHLHLEAVPLCRCQAAAMAWPRWWCVFNLLCNHLPNVEGSTFQ